MKIQRHRKFDKQYRKLSQKIQEKVDDTLLLFVQNPIDNRLNNHKLHGKLMWCRSLDVMWDLRIVFRDIGEGAYEIVQLIDVGTHSQLYG